MKTLKFFGAEAPNVVKLNLQELIDNFCDSEVRIDDEDSFGIDLDTEVSVEVNGKKVRADSVKITLKDSSDRFVEMHCPDFNKLAS